VTVAHGRSILSKEDMKSCQTTLIASRKQTRNHGSISHHAHHHGRSVGDE